MMFCDHPEKFFPVTQVDIVHFPEGSIENPDVMIEAPKIVGPVSKIINDTLSYLRTNVIKQRINKPMDNAQSIKVFNYPYQAFEEAVVNALYHRDYREREPVEITIEPSHVDILSYAGPDRSISAEAIKAAKKLKARRYRNRRLGDFLKELGLTEGRATGIPTIQKHLKLNGNKPAEIDTDDDRTYFLMTIHSREGFENLPSDTGGEKPKETSRELEQVFGCDSVQVQSAVAQSAVVDKSRLRHILEQLYVQVWSKSKSKPNILKLSATVIDMLCLLENKDLSANAINKILGYGATYDLKRKIIIPLSQLGYIIMSNPDKPTSARQTYMLTEKGRELFLPML